ncbi:DNA/RNA helicase [Neobacillus piezotolerans]|uniref:DNA/RNA helicase n=1 Tax=Neobacillus piezotolerans TaxID=2259171 RepID=A0A3D8GTE1_9BACI|nr:DEAD/DEAH box helicase [Neobacillus piezotolerans]RDU37592.1 DNA/RNA helicase [Neobacillus piezotolerans]
MRFNSTLNRITPINPTYSKHGHPEFPPGTLRISQIETIPQPTPNPNYTFNPDLQQILAGKQLLLDDLGMPLEEIQAHYENGFITFRKGIERHGKKPSCSRCGNKDPGLFASFACSRCGEVCVYCRKCIMMGRVSECTPLIGWTGPEPSFKNPGKILEWQGTLSDGQQIAATRAVETVRQHASLLVWAVCGAGKTEVLFPAIEAAIADGKRTCIATPRTDVVLELAPRLKEAFPSIKIASLYGGSEDRHTYAQLTIATTHQLLRFRQAFDTMILDEVDAFPYTMDESLQFAAEKARKLGSSIIYLTATPSRKWQAECRSGKRPYVTIPARFHRHPLPVPEFSWCGNWKKQLQKKQLPKECMRWINDRIKTGKQALVFFPHIESMQAALPILQKFHNRIESVHAEDPDRKEKVLRMRNGETPILLTTTILERGVTLANIDVAVIGSEDRIFTESALVQIAGRAGRSASYPTGTVTFFHFGKTNAMVDARKQILSMNREGKAKGLLD